MRKRYLLLSSLLVAFIASGSFAWAAPMLQGAVSLRIEPTTVTTTRGGEFSVDVILDSGQQPIDGAQITLVFDSDYLEVLSITPGAALPDVLQQGYNNEEGWIRYAAGKLFGDLPQGEFGILRVRFRALEATDETSIEFSEDPPFPSRVSYAAQNLATSMVDGVVIIAEMTSTPTASPLPTSTPEPESSTAYPPPVATATPILSATGTPTSILTATPTAASPTLKPSTQGTSRPSDTPTATGSPTSTKTTSEVQSAPSPTETRPIGTPSPPPGELNVTSAVTPSPQGEANLVSQEAETVQKTATGGPNPWSIVAIVAIAAFVLAFAAIRRKWLSD